MRFFVYLGSCVFVVAFVWLCLLLFVGFLFVLLVGLFGLWHFCGFFFLGGSVKIKERMNMGFEVELLWQSTQSTHFSSKEKKPRPVLIP